MSHPAESSRPTRRVFLAANAALAASASRPARGQKSTERKLDRLRVAVVGVQGHTGEVVPHLPTTPGCTLIAAARSWPDEKIEGLRNSAAWTADTRIYDDYRKMLDEAKPDIVAVFAPYAHNGRVNLEAVRRGCHVISEKPLASAVEDLHALRQEAERAKVRVTALLPLRLTPAFVAARQAVRDGLVGEPVLVSAQKSYKWGSSRPWYFKLRKDYGGSIPWVAIHAIDFIRYVSGLEYADVTARQAVKVHTDYPECEDCGALLFGMAGGGQTTLTFDYLRPPTATSHGDDRLRVAGSKGIVEVRLAGEPLCELVTLDEKPRQLTLARAPGNLFTQFVEALRGGSPGVLTPEDSFRATEVALKARDAADTHKTVPL